MQSTVCPPESRPDLRPLILGGGGVAADLADHLTAPGGAVLFLGSRLTPAIRADLDTLGEAVATGRVSRVCVVGSFRLHLGDDAAEQAERYALDRLAGARAGVAVIRPSHVLSPRSPLTAWLRRLSWAWPLVPARFRSCCVEGTELFAAIEATLGQQGTRAYTLLGANRPWRDRLRETGRGPALLTVLATLLSFLLVGQVLGLLVSLLARVLPRLRAWDLDTLAPTDLGELLALVNPYNRRHVKVVGYNNGVFHFGQRHPGRTVVVTAGCNRLTRLGGHRATFDAGVTVGQAAAFLAVAGKELHVLPNYSYVCLGTAFFVPIHGSAGDFSTVADTVEKAVLYDPAGDRIVVARRGDAAFGENLYNLGSEAVLLRLTLRVKDRSRYYLERRELPGPTGSDLLAAFHDPEPSNVEVRKARGSDRQAVVYRYYARPRDGGGEAMEFPRDAVGRLWDRLHANPLLSPLFHGLTRLLAYHVEVFFTEEEFVTFWETHRGLPIAKIQLRTIRRDGQPHSPFRDHDCVSADLFMLRRHKAAFDRYLRENFRHAQLNPGKHSL